MTEPRTTSEQDAAPAARTGPTGTELLAAVTSVPGVRAIEPGLGTTLRTLDARLRRNGDHTSHFGLHIDTAGGTALVEVALDRSRPIRETVRDIQLASRRVLADQAGTADAAVTVRVQSLQ